ncbi:MAG: hypothetical protein H7268_05015 [Sandarakinorhabdus sp.]|nr:hypothetical protein [Sandarakinorhabdus sp.]
MLLVESPSCDAIAPDMERAPDLLFSVLKPPLPPTSQAGAAARCGE